MFCWLPILTGLTKRSNEAAVQQLSRIFEGRYAVLGLRVPGAGESTLHLKSIMTALDAHTILVADGPAGREVVALVSGCGGMSYH